MYNKIDLIKHIRNNRAQWVVHVTRIRVDVQKKILLDQKGKEGLEKPKRRWLHDVDQDSERVGERNWRRQARNNDEW